jgi:FMN phosphatase YigB (HAD superfamily)
MIKLVTFDVVGTLVKFKGHIPTIYAQAAKKYGVDADAEKIALGFRTSFKELNTKYPIFGAKSELTSKDWWRQFVRNTFIVSGMIRHYDV